MIKMELILEDRSNYSEVQTEQKYSIWCSCWYIWQLSLLFICKMV